ncbi:MAG TPA: hypothetical protein VGL97_02105 [Bryobacteraceae bacterium]
MLIRAAISAGVQLPPQTLDGSSEGTLSTLLERLFERRPRLICFALFLVAFVLAPPLLLLQVLLVLPAKSAYFSLRRPRSGHIFEVSKISDIVNIQRACNTSGMKTSAMESSDAKAIHMLYAKELLDRIEDYRYRNRFPTRVQAIKALLHIALESEKKKAAKG